MKGVSFRRVNHVELELPPLAKVRWLGGRIFWPKAGILVRLRSLGVAIPVREAPPVAQNTGILPKITGIVSGIAPEAGRGAQIKILRALSYGDLSARARLCALSANLAGKRISNFCPVPNRAA